MRKKLTDEMRELKELARQTETLGAQMHEDLEWMKRNMVTKDEIAALGDRFDELSRLLLDWK